MREFLWPNFHGERDAAPGKHQNLVGFDLSLPFLGLVLAARSREINRACATSTPTLSKLTRLVPCLALFERARMEFESGE